ncbi:MAG: fumarate hydratase, partial [Victivallales bacterium]|nr:fumarate hydratase [Victivallales bacterium]
MANDGKYKATLLKLIADTSSALPEDVIAALRKAADNAENGSAEATALATMLENAALAKERRLPVCQDTGSLLFFIDAPSGFDTLSFEEDARAAVAEATATGLLRQNCVESLTGHNTGNNIGYGSPSFQWHFERRRDIHVSLLMKGGGSENMGVQYSLPDSELGAGCDLEGVRRCILHAVQHAQGMGCAPGVLGVAI